MKAKRLNKVVKRSQKKRMVEVEEEKKHIIDFNIFKKKYHEVYLAKKKRFNSFMYEFCNFATLGGLSLVDKWSKNSLEERSNY